MRKWLIGLAGLTLLSSPALAAQTGPSNITCAAAIGSAQVLLALDEQTDTTETRAELSQLTKARWDAAIASGEAADLPSAQQATSAEVERIMVPVLNGEAGAQEYLGELIEVCLGL